LERPAVPRARGVATAFAVLRAKFALVSWVFAVLVSFSADCLCSAVVLTRFASMDGAAPVLLAQPAALMTTVSWAAVMKPTRFAAAVLLAAVAFLLASPVARTGAIVVRAVCAAQALAAAGDLAVVLREGAIGPSDLLFGYFPQGNYTKCGVRNENPAISAG
jgi:hypothetical protein